MGLRRWGCFIDADLGAGVRRPVPLGPRGAPAPDARARLDLVVKIVAFIVSDQVETF